MLIGSGPSLMTLTSIMPGSGNCTRWTVSVSIGGAVRSPNPPSVARMTASTPTSSSNGTSASRATRGVNPVLRSSVAPDLVLGIAVVSANISSLADIEHAHPSEFAKLRNMRVEHVLSWLMIGVVVAKFEDAALCLRLHDRIDRAQIWLELGAGVVVVEEVR